MGSNDLLVHFWGVRGSYPTTGIPTARYGGNTACVSVELPGYTLIWDAGTGIIALGEQLARRAQESGKPLTGALLFSHYHHDHTQGFPFFAPTRMPDTQLKIFGPCFDNIGPGDVLARVMTPPLFPVSLADLPAQITYEVIDGNSRIALAGASLAEPAQIFTLRSTEHLEEVFHYKFVWRGRSVVYATDREGFPEDGNPLIEFARGADVLIHDAQYTEAQYYGREPDRPGTAGYGHSTVRMACQAAQKAGVKLLVLFHHAPDYDDGVLARLALEARQYFPNTVTAYEGMQIRLSAGSDGPPAVNAEFPPA